MNKLGLGVHSQPRQVCVFQGKYSVHWGPPRLQRCKFEWLLPSGGTVEGAEILGFVVCVSVNEKGFPIEEKVSILFFNAQCSPAYSPNSYLFYHAPFSMSITIFVS